MGGTVTREPGRGRSRDRADKDYLSYVFLSASICVLCGQISASFSSSHPRTILRVFHPCPSVSSVVKPSSVFLFSRLWMIVFSPLSPHVPDEPADQHADEGPSQG